MSTYLDIFFVCDVAVWLLTSLLHTRRALQ